MAKIQEHDIFHGGIYWVPEKEEELKFVSNYGGFVRFNAFSEDAAFEPLDTDGCWGGFTYDDPDDFRQYSPIEGATLDYASTQDFLSAVGFEPHETEKGSFVQYDGDNHHISVKCGTERSTYDVRFWGDKTMFDEAYDHTYTIRYLHELQRLMIHHGHGKRAIAMWDEYKEEWDL